MPVGDQQEQAQKRTSSAVSQRSRRPRAQHVPQHQADIERADMGQQPLEDTLLPAQSASPHSTRLIAVSKTSIH
jgi:hypothetical protein